MNQQTITFIRSKAIYAACNDGYHTNKELGDKSPGRGPTAGTGLIRGIPVGTL